MSAALSQQSFATLFRQSKLASVTYNNGGMSGQVLWASAEQRSRGEFGIKYTLKGRRTATAVVRNLDNPLHTPPATTQLAQNDRFRRIFSPFVKREEIASSQQKTENTIALDRISDAEFAQLVRQAKQLIKEDRESWESILCIASDSDTSATHVHPPFYYAPKTPANSSSTSEPISLFPTEPATSVDRTAPRDPRTIPIKARYLNAVHNGHAVGIAGFVAFLPYSETSTSSRVYTARPTSDRGIKNVSSNFADVHSRVPGNEVTVYVQDVTWDGALGRWKIGVTQKNPAEAHILFDALSAPSAVGAARGKQQTWLSSASWAGTLGQGSAAGASETASTRMSAAGGLDSFSILQSVASNSVHSSSNNSASVAAAAGQQRKRLPAYLQKRSEGMKIVLDEIMESSNNAETFVKESAKGSDKSQ
ncbi:hypothetical protein BC830DRAFT_1094216 [Chytriomyces sp. MP71]|nr:hypothetical protein BC830DRAFT_1094216 [Chytriomyces sp. MP71]